MTDQRRAVYLRNDLECMVTLPRHDSWVAVELTVIYNPAHFYVSFPFGTKSVPEIQDESVSDGGSCHLYINLRRSCDSLFTLLVCLLVTPGRLCWSFNCYVVVFLSTVVFMSTPLYLHYGRNIRTIIILTLINVFCW